MVAVVSTLSSRSPGRRGLGAGSTAGLAAAGSALRFRFRSTPNFARASRSSLRASLAAHSSGYTSRRSQPALRRRAQVSSHSVRAALRQRHGSWAAIQANM